MATKKDTENNNPSAPVPADNDITMLTMVTKQNWDEAIKDESGVLYSKDGKRLLERPDFVSNYNIKEGTEIIGDSAFSWCKSLTSITVPPSVTAIGNRAFFNCECLTSITIPLSVTNIGD